MRSMLLGLVGLVLLAMCGCSSSSSISGNVTVDGEPLKEGRIAFAPEGGGQGGGGDIRNGSYSVSLPKGKYRVEITAEKMMPLPEGQKGMYGEKEEKRQYLPEKYNTKSELKAEVPASGPVDFKLETKKAGN